MHAPFFALLAAGSGLGCGGGGLLGGRRGRGGVAHCDLGADIDEPGVHLDTCMSCPGIKALIAVISRYAQISKCTRNLEVVCTGKQFDIPVVSPAN